VLPFGTIIDTNWLGKRLGDDFHGFMWSRKLGGMCADEDDPNTYGPKWLTQKLNDKMKSMLPKVYSESNKDEWGHPEALGGDAGGIGGGEDKKEGQKASAAKTAGGPAEDAAGSSFTPNPATVPGTLETAGSSENTVGLIPMGAVSATKESASSGSAGLSVKDGNIGVLRGSLGEVGEA
jgi:hypothetical protein